MYGLAQTPGSTIFFEAIKWTQITIKTTTGNILEGGVLFVFTTARTDLPYWVQTWRQHQQLLVLGLTHKDLTHAAHQHWNALNPPWQSNFPLEMHM